MIQLKNISKSYPTKTLFQDLNLTISGRQVLGVVGPNGSGKSTLLKIIAGIDTPDQGEVIKHHHTIGYLAQDIDDNSKTNRESIKSYLSTLLEHDWETYKIDIHLATVGLATIDQSTPLSSLSGGQKIRVGLAYLLLTEPDVILLDEPTNNLDLIGLDWLEQFITNFSGIVICISHDRTFLNQTVDSILELDPYTQQPMQYHGNYDDYVEQKRVLQEKQLAAYLRQQKQERHMRDWINQKQEQLKYHQNNKVARQLQAMKTRFQREIEQNKLDKPQKYQSFKLKLAESPIHNKRTVISLEDFAIPGLITIQQTYVYGKDRLLLEGNNGSGKTTLIRSILGINQRYQGVATIDPAFTVGYFSQTREWLDTSQPLIEEFIKHALVKAEPQARNVLGSFHFRQDMVYQKIELLSIGERVRLMIAILLNQQNDYLILDEPTNHLDIESRQVIEQALAHYQGGFMIVSHDRYFLNQIGINRILTIKNQSLI